jgi:hypothetical protein
VLVSGKTQSRSDRTQTAARNSRPGGASIRILLSYVSNSTIPEAATARAGYQRLDSLLYRIEKSKFHRASNDDCLRSILNNRTPRLLVESTMHESRKSLELVDAVRIFLGN